MPQTTAAQYNAKATKATAAAEIQDMQERLTKSEERAKMATVPTNCESSCFASETL
jgi:hypothetical protein